MNFTLYPDQQEFYRNTAIEVAKHKRVIACAATGFGKSKVFITIAQNAIAKNKTGEVANQLTALDERRATMSAKAKRARDYLDWFEITRARETSGAFDDYMRLKDRLKANPHRRSDDLSKYLDRMDAIFSRGAEPP
jgi:hypothetical protein